jgi:hypothetical protein
MKLINSTTRRLVAAVFFPLALLVTAGQAQEPELVTDRPDQTESTAIVPAGRTQIEAGATFARDDGEGFEVDLTQVPGTLVRIGLSERFELRLGWDGWLEEDVTVGGVRGSIDGFGDASVGAKALLRQGDGLSPAIAVIAATSVPVGEEPFSSDRFDPGMRISVSHDLAGGIGLGYNAGVETASEERPEGGHTTLAAGVYTISAGVPAGEKTGVFVELFGDVPLSAPGGPSHLFDAGVTHLLRPHVQLDFAAGVGLNERAADWFAGIGVSVRLPR